MPTEKYSYSACVFIGRFQPFHDGHYRSVRIALRAAKKLVIVLGGYRAAPSTRGPWSAEERIEMIKSAFPSSLLKRIHFVCVRDRIHAEEIWKENVRYEVLKITGGEEPVAIIGHEKDSSSYYLKIFPEWFFLETGNYRELNATQIREQLFYSSSQKNKYDNIPESIVNWLKKYKKTSYFLSMKEEYLAEKSYKLKNKINSEFTRVFFMHGKYVLLMTRKQFPGKELYCLPELAFNSKAMNSEFALQNLFDKVCLKINVNDINKYLIEFKLFSYNDGSYYGNTKSHCYFYNQTTNGIPDFFKYTNYNEDMHWVLLDDIFLNESHMYGDHFQIMQYFLFSNKR